MEPVDAAYIQLQELKSEIDSYKDSVVTEADARLKVIDRIFFEVLGWLHRDVLTEDPSRAGFLDYNFQIDSRSRLIVEAKRDGRTLGVTNRPARRGFLLSGPVFKEQAAAEGIAQAIKYCGIKNAELACVTNGAEWIIFRGNRLGDGVDTDRGMAFVFPSLDSVVENFLLFFDLLSYESVRSYSYRANFQEAEGLRIRSTSFKRSLVAPGSARRLPVRPLSADIDRVMSTFFDRLAGSSDPDLLVECFVETDESRAADVQLARVSEDLVGRIRTLDTSEASILSQVIERAAQAQRHEFVVIVGTKGAGKSTFITRFFQKVLKPEIAKECVSLRVNLADGPGDKENVVPWLDRHFLAELEKAIFSAGPPGYEELQGVFFDHYTRLRNGPWAVLYETDRNQFKIKFGNWLEKLRTDSPNDYIVGLIRHAVTNRKKLPVIVLDNADHFDVDFQERVYQYARSIYEREVCLVIIPITDRTSWQLSRQGALQSFENETLFLPTPAAQLVISKRIDFLHDRVQTEREKPDDRYFIKNGISLSVKDLTALTKSLSSVFLHNPETARWIGNLSNGNIRWALKICRVLVSSANLSMDDIVKAHLSGEASSVRRSQVAKALIRMSYKTYPDGTHEFIQNVFGLAADTDTSPLLSIRILQLLKDARDDSGHEDALVPVDDVIQYFSSINVDARATLSHIDALLKTGLARNSDPTVLAAKDASQIELAPSGEQHLAWSKANWEYISAMADVTSILSEEWFSKLQATVQQGGAGWRAKTAVFIEYLRSEDSAFCKLLDHESYAGQVQIGEALASTQAALERSIS